MEIETPHAYILTLFSSEERTNNVSKNIIPYLAKDKYEIYPAIDARTKELELLVEKYPKLKKIKLTDPEDDDLRNRKALIYAFSMILDDVKIREKAKFIFFEDDAVLLPMFYFNLQNAISQLPDDWDILKLHCCRQKLNTNKKIKVHKYPPLFGGSFYGTDAILFSMSGILKISNLLYLSEFRGIDSLVHDVGIRSGNIKGYYVNNTICAHQHEFLKTTLIGKRYGY